jgi:hypothetical protein
MQPRLNLLPQSFAISLQLGRVFTAESQSPQSCIVKFTSPRSAAPQLNSDSISSVRAVFVEQVGHICKSVDGWLPI